MKLSLRHLIKVSLICLGITLLYVFYSLLSGWDTSFEKSPVVTSKIYNKDTLQNDASLLFKNVDSRFEDMYNFKAGLKFLTKKSKNVRYPKHEIEIWGKASIAEYLWNHIMDANSTTYANGLIKHGEITLENLQFRFRSGPGIVQNTVPTSVKNLVLVFNGKDESKMKFTKYWLDYLIHFKSLKNVALVILGDEKCNNDWILPYLKTRGGLVDIVFLIYDCKLIDNREFYQWPLGVATYRGFPNLKLSHVNVEVSRQHVCSFVGTVYKNSSREVLHNILKKSGKCFVGSRDVWVPSETHESMSKYIKILSESDLALNPVGQNTECYRIYEALSLGTVPVVEDVVTPGNCDTQNNAPLRLLKEYKAPVIFIKNWNDLDLILKMENEMTLEKKVERRKKTITWYHEFKEKMKKRFIEAIKKHFFKE